MVKMHWGRELCGDASLVCDREWLVTNGLGGYACGTVAGVLSRHYHGLLIAALQPPLQRTLLVTKLEEWISPDPTDPQGRELPLHSDRWAEGHLHPQGYRYLDSFSLEDQIPCWRYRWGLTCLEKRVWMTQGENTTTVHYRLLTAAQPLHLRVNVLVNYRNHHLSTVAEGWRMAITPVDQGLRVQAFPDAVPVYLRSGDLTLTPEHQWQRGYDLALERYRGIFPQDDHLCAASGTIVLHPEQPLTLVFSTEAQATLNGASSLAQRQHYAQGLVASYRQLHPPNASDPDWLNPVLDQLVLAADQFLVERTITNPNTQQKIQGKTTIAGYPWFGDWGRDTMISLPGLCLTTGRFDIARFLLETFGQYLSQGMLPNVFPTANQAPNYNTLDATFWYFPAIAHYCQQTQDWSLLEQLFPALTDVITWHQRGTRYGIHWDAQDGLIAGGEAGVQLTWMDAKVGDWVVTPRRGKPVEINALWYNALVLMAEFAQHLGRSPQPYSELAQFAHQGFQRFWSNELGYCYDVIDSDTAPGGLDSSLRPNQLLAVLFPRQPQRFPPLLTREQSRAIVHICGQHLLTAHGLRSLAPQDPHYQGHYGGSPLERDGAYHQGTVWGWWLGLFAEAHYRVHHDRTQALDLLQPLGQQLHSQCLGSLGEIFDGDPPFTPRGAFAQAWTVAEVLRVATDLRKDSP